MKPVVLCILDGVGYRTERHGNAFLAAKTPCFDQLWEQYPHSLLEASGEAVGLPAEQMGNSEVGHMNLGAGRIVYQPLQFITEKIKDGTFYQNETLLSIFNHVKEKGTRLHIMGLLSDGGIHSTIAHLMALIDFCKKVNVTNVYFHLYTDGRDTLTDVSLNYFEALNEKIKQVGFGVIATISGRYYAMDRDNRMDRLEKSYRAIVDGDGEKYSSYEQVIKHNYENGIMDEFIVPAVLDEDGCVKDGDGIIFFNYRPDRLRELGSALTNPNFNAFEVVHFQDVPLVTMMPISDEAISKHAFDLKKLNDTLGEYVASKGIHQLRIAETEKYAHVTYFFDGGEEKELSNCKRILIPSPQVATYDLSPDMSVSQITDALLKEIDQYHLVILNYANGDMLGHTGVMEATIQSLETMDHCLKRLYEKVKELNGVLIVTADHGNCEYLLDDDDHVITSHTTSLVPFLITDSKLTLENGKLSDVAPTILSLLGLDIPEAMTGKNLIVEK